jgi:hypothetical protein
MIPRRSTLLGENAGAPWAAHLVRTIFCLGPWAAYTRQLELIGEHYGSRAQAATACWHCCRGEKKISIAEILTAEPS